MTDEALEQLAPAAWKPNAGPQERYLACGAFEALYGGAAGGGKTEAQLIDPLRFIHLPRFAALLLRRTVPELKRSGSLIDRSYSYYPNAGGEPREGGKLWLFPSGARIELASMELESDRFNYSSAEYQHIGFDELSSFSEVQYVFMISRLRSSAGIPRRIRSGTNPGGEGHEWILKRFAPWFYPDGHAEYDGPRAGPEERLYTRFDPQQDREVWCERDWYDTTCGACVPPTLTARPRACNDHKPLARVFFPAKLADNPSLAKTNYGAQLDRLDPVTRAWLKHGDWLAKPAAGAYFKRPWFEIVDATPSEVLARVRYWDRAATSGAGDWTAGVRESRTAGGLFFVENVVRGQWAPLEVEKTIEQTLALDPRGTRTVLEQDPGQAGKFEVSYYVRKFAGADIHAVPPQGDKITRAKPVSAQAEAENIKLVRGPWNEAFLREHENFPEGHDDQVDAHSGAFVQLMRYGAAKAQSGGTVREMAKKAGGF